MEIFNGICHEGGGVSRAINVCSNFVFLKKQMEISAFKIFQFFLYFPYVIHLSGNFCKCDKPERNPVVNVIREKSR